MMVLAIVLATALPVPKDGPCPPRHSSSNHWCVPQPGAGQAVPRAGGSCPSGFTSSGRYCVGRP